MEHLRRTDSTAEPPAVALATAARRLRAVGADPLAASLAGAVSWHGDAGLAAGWPATEATVQARCGLMGVHGRDAGVPRRLGLDVASVAAGILAAQGALAAGLAAARGGGRPAAPATSVLQAGLVLLSHYLVVATGLGDAVPGPPLPEPGPPFRSADGRWFEIETLDPEAWKALWVRQGAGGADLGRAWTVFRWRYERAACSLPPGLHEAAGRHTLAEWREACAAAGVSLVALGECPGLPAGGPWAPEVRRRGGAGRPPPAPAPAAGDPPLAGLRVVEATSRIQGPFAGMLLRMLGADVVRVQPPEGDYGRAAATLHRGKAVVSLDLATPPGRAGLAGLVAGADAFLHNWRPGRAEAWGLGPDDLARANPRLVYAAASGWGPHPPAGDPLGTDFLVQADTGLGCLLAPEGEPPFPSRVILSDLFGALLAAEGVLAALYRRETEGGAWVVETSLRAGALALRDAAPPAAAKGGSGRPVWGALDRPVPTAAGWLVVGAGEDGAFARLCEVCGVDPLGGARSATEEAVAARLAGRPAGEWEATLGRAGVAAAAAPASLADVAADPRLSGCFEPVGDGVAPRPPWSFG